MLNAINCVFSACLSLKLKYFDDPVAQCMQSLDSLDSRDLSQKCEFFTRLAQTIPAFPRVSAKQVSSASSTFVMPYYAAKDDDNIDDDSDDDNDDTDAAADVLAAVEVLMERA